MVAVVLSTTVSHATTYKCEILRASETWPSERDLTLEFTPGASTEMSIEVAIPGGLACVARRAGLGQDAHRAFETSETCNLQGDSDIQFFVRRSNTRRYALELQLYASQTGVFDFGCSRFGDDRKLLILPERR